MNYNYNQEIETKLQEFESYLRTKRYAIPTIQQARNYAGVYLSWLSKENKLVDEIGYNEFSNFIFHLKKDKSVNQTRRIILSVRHYYESLSIDKNPASGIHIRGRKTSMLNELVSYEELEKLYQNYSVLDDRAKRNKVILGILIYQGITTGELQQLETMHLKLDEGKMYIPSKGKTNSRTLALAPLQLLELQEYRERIRPKMLANINAHRSGRKPKQINPIINERLFFSESGNSSIKQSLYHMFRSIKKSHPKISSGKVIRTTVIAHWLKQEDIRIVQHKAGHRWVSSTERYNVYNLQELKEALEKYHPLK